MFCIIDGILNVIDTGEPAECSIVDCTQEFPVKKCPETCSYVEPELCKVADCQKP